MPQINVSIWNAAKDTRPSFLFPVLNSGNRKKTTAVEKPAFAVAMFSSVKFPSALCFCFLASVAFANKKARGHVFRYRGRVVKLEVVQVRDIQRVLGSAAGADSAQGLGAGSVGNSNRGHE